MTAFLTDLFKRFEIERLEAEQKARMAEDAWNSRDPERVALAYTPDSVWRNRAEFVKGREEIAAFLRRKWARELEYRLIKEVWAHQGNRIAVRFAYEWQFEGGQLKGSSVRMPAGGP